MGSTDMSTADEILMRCAAARSDMLQLSRMLEAKLFGLPVRVYNNLPFEKRVSNRVHKRRRNQKLSYHERIQKKWDKRFGTRIEQFVVMIDPQAAGLMFGGPTLTMSPEAMAILRGCHD